MKLRNKKTGEIGNLLPWVDYKTKKEMSHFAVVLDNRKEPLSYNSLSELNEEWEDVPEEPKVSVLDLMINTLSNFIDNEPDEDKVDLEDCKQMLEKLKAWQRLKDKGFRFKGITETSMEMECIEFDSGIDNVKERSMRGSQLNKDLSLLFGGEE